MDTTGIIFAALDCDADAIEDWNRWYDLEHLPPNAALPGIMTGRRYVATPDLHACRADVTVDAYGGGRATFATIYFLSGDPGTAMADMTALRDVLDQAGRMFAPERKAVRSGDALAVQWVVADAALRAQPADVGHLGHTGIRVVLRARRDGGKDGIEARARRAVGVPGVNGVLSFHSLFDPTGALDLYLLEDDLASAVDAARAVAPYDEGDVRADLVYRLIDPLRYPWAADIRASTLPARVA